MCGIKRFAGWCESAISYSRSWTRHLGSSQASRQVRVSRASRVDRLEVWRHVNWPPINLFCDRPQPYRGPVPWRRRSRNHPSSVVTIRRGGGAPGTMSDFYTGRTIVAYPKGTMAAGLRGLIDSSSLKMANIASVSEFSGRSRSPPSSSRATRCGSTNWTRWWSRTHDSSRASARRLRNRARCR